jgi:putative oxidoreductase
MTQFEDLGKLLLRVSIGVLMLFHGVSKLTGSGGLEWVVGEVQRFGVPGAVGYLVLVGEVLAPLLMVLGAWTRVAALIVAINMVVAVGMAHMKQLFTLAQTGGYALELQALYLLGALSVAFIGAGRLSLAGAHGRFN